MCVLCSKGMGGWLLHLCTGNKGSDPLAPGRLCSRPRAERYLLLWLFAPSSLGLAMGMSLFALVWLCLQHPVHSACRTFPSVGRRKLFLPLMHFVEWFLSAAALYLSLASELHSTHRCPTPTCYFSGPRGETLPPGGKVGMGRDPSDRSRP